MKNTLIEEIHSIKKGLISMSYLVDQSIERLKYNNVRITPQRHAILEYLIDKDTHPTADDVYQALESRFPSMSVATVYNNLRLFIELGLVKEMKYGDSSSRFDFSSTEHYHAICTECGKIEDIYYPGLDDVEVVASNLTGFEVTSHRLEIYGLCPDCQKNSKL
ncbi:Fur family transcriptional regulator, peroxide stress response regulator [Marinilactibacillus piezotolerans]|uniref:Fur family transcriptional regulator, peroxide stress response regulator n=2 Tax=Carnobacteriaceae TaxID=186828 RepID=A0A1I3USW9_9LACT|nr:Fur family transcriptional regulator, peroxide stress response regulator [Marinilactibacillus piezotolerans]